MKELTQKETDVLVIGGGAAGCRAALEAVAAGCQVILASKYPVTKSGASVVAESFYAAPLGEETSPGGLDLYLEDIIRGGCYLSDFALADRLTRDGCARIEDLGRLGVQFKKDVSGAILKMKGPGHSRPRALAPVGGGLGIMRRLRKELRKQAEAFFWEDFLVSTVLTGEGAVTGVLGLDLRTGDPALISCRAVIIATGGYSTLWSYNDVPCDCTGEGIIMAYMAGADLIDLEMVLFYPTVIIHPPSLYGMEVPHGLFIEQVKGKILNGRGQEFVRGDIPTRDVMVSLIYAELAQGNGSPHGGVYLDLTRDERSREKLKKDILKFLPEKYKYLLKHGVDITRQALEVAPMAHYSLGGIKIDADCRTRVPGLFAAGEAAGGVHGANRLAGNALPDTQVFGVVAGRAAASFAKKAKPVGLNREQVYERVRKMEACLEPKPAGIHPAKVKSELQELMWTQVGVNRQEAGLREALAAIKKMKSDYLPRLAVAPARTFNLGWIHALETANMLELAALVTAAALARQETRGHHFRLDFPERNDGQWLKHIVFRRVGGKDERWTEPVEKRTS